MASVRGPMELSSVPVYQVSGGSCQGSNGTSSVPVYQVSCTRTLKEIIFFLLEPKPRLFSMLFQCKKIYTDGYNVMQIKSFIAFYTWVMILDAWEKTLTFVIFYIFLQLFKS